MQTLPDCITLPNGKRIVRIAKAHDKYIVESQFSYAGIEIREDYVFFEVLTAQGHLVSRVFTSLVKCIKYLVGTGESYLD